MRKNLVILTHGWTGSSVFSALVGEGGYWTGSETVKKTDYDTHENANLVNLNRRMLDELQFDGDHEHEFSTETIAKLANNTELVDLAPYRDFVEHCGAHRPWVWKDPRLTWTIRTWAKVLDLEQTRFMILTRDDTQAWISSNLRRHIQSFRFTKEYNHGITKSNIAFLEERNLPYIRFAFEDLLLNPSDTVTRINEFLDLSLDMDDLKRVYTYELGKKSRGVKDFVVASLIYLKNYNERSA